MFWISLLWEMSLLVSGGKGCKRLFSDLCGAGRPPPVDLMRCWIEEHWALSPGVAPQQTPARLSVLAQPSRHKAQS